MQFRACRVCDGRARHLYPICLPRLLGHPHLVNITFIVPFHRDLASLTRCLDAFNPLPPGCELIIAADAPVDDCQSVARSHGARVIAIAGPSGPAAARNAAAAAALGDVLVFVDADVVVSRSAVARIEQIFHEQPQTAAVFGSYDEQPDDPGFASQYKNLSHSFIHQSSAAKARTFWTGFGAVRREVFLAVGGFDERFKRPSVEDIDFGYRLSEAGHQVVLDATLSACHLKRWTVQSAIMSDVRDRGIPWTQLILRYKALHNDLNLRIENRLCIPLAYLTLVLLAIAPHAPRFLAGLPLTVAALTVLNRQYYGFLYEKRGGLFAVRAWGLHLVHHLCNGFSFAAGTLLFFAARYLGLFLPGALFTEPWTATRTMSVAASVTARERTTYAAG